MVVKQTTARRQNDAESVSLGTPAATQRVQGTGYESTASDLLIQNMLNNF